MGSPTAQGKGRFGGRPPEKKLAIAFTILLLLKLLWWLLYCGQLSSLEEFAVRYGVADCGMNFEWKVFDFTRKDCRLLATALAKCSQLRVFRINSSHVSPVDSHINLAKILRSSFPLFPVFFSPLSVHFHFLRSFPLSSHLSSPFTSLNTNGNPGVTLCYPQILSYPWVKKQEI